MGKLRQVSNITLINLARGMGSQRRLGLRHFGYSIVSISFVAGGRHVMSERTMSS